jgi:hypothetical protein
MGKYVHEQKSFVTKKALACGNEDLKVLGIEHTLLNINLPALMVEEPLDDSIPFVSGGKNYWFDRAAVEDVDRVLQNAWQYGVAATAILLNAPRLFDSRGEEALLKKVIHPDFEWQNPNAFISAFSVADEEGCGYYRAFVEFLSDRYMRDDAAYGRLTGFIVSNEVNSQYIWGNAGDKTVEEYTKEYTKALYVTWEAAKRYWEHAQVFLSLDHCWGEAFDHKRPGGSYRGRDIVDLVNRYGKELGDFGWGIAYHPYPEDLRYPDFYNDRIPEFYFDTKLITFKNMEVLHAYLGQPEFLYRGERRPIVLSEQGFNSRETAFSEMQGAAAYVLAYEKMRKLPGILWMTHHAYMDNLKEFGLHLGIRERNADGTPGRKRPIYEAMRDMGTQREQERVAWAREFIGEALYEELESPVVHAQDRDQAQDMEFGT